MNKDEIDKICSPATYSRALESYEKNVMHKHTNYMQVTHHQ